MGEEQAAVVLELQVVVVGVVEVVVVLVEWGEWEVFHSVCLLTSSF